MATRNRDARRRKIMDKGADRLALITGQIRNVEPSSTVVQFESKAEIAQESGSLATAASPAPSANDDDSVGFAMRDPANVDDEGKVGNPANGGNVGTTTRESKASITLGECEIPTLYEQRETSIGRKASQLSATQQPDVRPSFSEPSVITRKQIYATTSGKKFISAISETEESRLLCSVVIAVMVVLSTWGFPLFNVFGVNSIICFRPLCLLLLTNATIVAARIFFDMQRSSERPYWNNNPKSDEGDWIARAGKALEASFVLKKAMDAMLLDFSVYAIIVVCFAAVF